MSDQAKDDEWVEQLHLVQLAHRRFTERHYAGILSQFTVERSITFLAMPLTDEWGTLTIGEWGDYLIQIMPMIYNDRLIMTPRNSAVAYHHGWCYDKGGAAYLAALVWDPQTQGEPVGYKKRATAGIREAGAMASDDSERDDYALALMDALDMILPSTES